MILSFVKKYKIELIFALIGAFSGYAYWYYVGCASGTCPITSKWYTTTLYGVLMGFLLGQIITEKLDKRKNKESES